MNFLLQQYLKKELKLIWVWNHVAMARNFGPSYGHGIIWYSKSCWNSVLRSDMSSARKWSRYDRWQIRTPTETKPSVCTGRLLRSGSSGTARSRDR